MTKNIPNIVVVGGGTGTYTTLLGLKKYNVHLSAIVSMMDSGGSNRVIRDEFGLLPTSDIRQCIVALANEQTSDDDLRRLFMYRYETGTRMSGMTFGNLFMAALTDVYGSQEKAIDKTCEILRVEGDIVPVTHDNVQLIARYDNGKQVLGEHFIDEPDEETGKHKIVELEVVPRAKANPKALKAIGDADLIVMGPGDLFTSVICNLVVDGISDAICKSNAKKVYVSNLMTKFGQTNDYKVSNHIDEIIKYLRKGCLDMCLINKNHEISQNIVKRYEEEHATIVVNDVKKLYNGVNIVEKDLISDEVYSKPKSDVVVRSLIRHDSDKLAKALVGLL